MMNQKGNSIVIALIGIVVLAVVGLGLVMVLGNDDNNEKASNQTSSQDSNSPVEVEIDNATTAQVAPNNFTEYAYSAILDDVTGAKTLQSITFDGQSRGSAYADNLDGEYTLYATFENLPTAVPGTFYEGWVVGGESGVVSTGKLDLGGGIYTNIFTDGRDLTDSMRYVLTIEPDDGDPAPADHVVEGEFKKR